MLKIFMNLYCKMHWRAKAIDATSSNSDSNIHGRVLKIDFIKIDFLVHIIGKGYSTELHSPGNFLL